VLLKSPFQEASGKNIPHVGPVPTTNNNLFEKYQISPNPDTADELLKSLKNSRKEKWNELMENMNFTHSSLSCWSLLQKLRAANETTRSKSTISPNSVASHLVGLRHSLERWSNT
jgi:hypothetical protein